MSKTGGEGESRVCLVDFRDTRAGEEGGQVDDATERRPAGRPCRPPPADFIELWPQHGWDTAAEHWRCHPRSIERWVEACGRERMVLARKRYVEAQRAVAKRARAKRYVAGRTLSPVGRKGGTAETY